MPPSLRDEKRDGVIQTEIASYHMGRKKALKCDVVPTSTPNAPKFLDEFYVSWLRFYYSFIAGLTDDTRALIDDIAEDIGGQDPRRAARFCAAR